MNLTKLFTSNQPDPPQTSSKQGELTRNLLNLDPSDIVFYVGGYPSNFTVSTWLHNNTLVWHWLKITFFSDWFEAFLTSYNIWKCCFDSLQPPSTTPTIRDASSCPPSMTDSSVCTTLRRLSRSTWRLHARGWFRATESQMSYWQEIMLLDQRTTKTKGPIFKMP